MVIFLKSQCWPQICIFISFYWSLKANTQVIFVWILPIKLVGEKIAPSLVSSQGVFCHLFNKHLLSANKHEVLGRKRILSSKLKEFSLLAGQMQKPVFIAQKGDQLCLEEKEMISLRKQYLDERYISSTERREHDILDSKSSMCKGMEL